MKLALRCGSIFMLAAMLPALAGAQMGMHAGPAMRGIFNPVVGSGGEYEMTTDKGKTLMEISVVGKESVDGKDGYWFEMAISKAWMGQMISKVWRFRDGRAPVVSRMIMKGGTPPPMEMPTQMYK